MYGVSIANKNVVYYTSACSNAPSLGAVYVVSIANKNIVYCTSACSNAPSLGVAYGGKIPDSSFSATSNYGSKWLPKYGRLNFPKDGWEPRTNNLPNEYLQIDLGAEYWVCGVATQGEADQLVGDDWVTKYKISLSLDDVTWNIYQNNGSDKV